MRGVVCGTVLSWRNWPLTTSLDLVWLTRVDSFILRDIINYVLCIKFVAFINRECFSLWFYSGILPRVCNWAYINFTCRLKRCKQWHSYLCYQQQVHRVFSSPFVVLNLILAYLFIYLSCRFDYEFVGLLVKDISLLSLFIASFSSSSSNYNNLPLLLTYFFAFSPLVLYTLGH